MFTALIILAYVVIPVGLLLFGIYVEKWANRSDVEEYEYETI